MGDDSPPARPAALRDLPPPPPLVQYGVTPAQLQHDSVTESMPMRQDQRWEIERKRQLAESIRLLQEKARSRRLVGMSVVTSAQTIHTPKPAVPAADHRRAPVREEQNGGNTRSSDQTSSSFSSAAAPNHQSTTTPVQQAQPASEQRVALIESGNSVAAPVKRSSPAPDDVSTASKRGALVSDGAGAAAQGVSPSPEQARPVAERAPPAPEQNIPAAKTVLTPEHAGAAAARGSTADNSSCAAKRASPAPDGASRTAKRPRMDSISESSGAPDQPGESSPTHKLKKAWLSRMATSEVTSDGLSIAVAPPHAAAERGRTGPAEPHGRADPTTEEDKPTPVSANATAEPVAARGGADLETRAERMADAAEGEASIVSESATHTLGGPAVSNGRTSAAEAERRSDSRDVRVAGENRTAAAPAQIKAEPGGRDCIAVVVKTEPIEDVELTAGMIESSGGGEVPATVKVEQDGERLAGGDVKPAVGPAAAETTKNRKRGRPIKSVPVATFEPRVSYAVLKKTGQSFLQYQFCCEIQAKLPRCRECRAVPVQRWKKPSGIYCRFTAFRRLRYTRTGQLSVAGFSQPAQDSVVSDREQLWHARLDGTSRRGMQREVATFLLQCVAGQFCDLVADEQAARACHVGNDQPVAWKRVVQGCRELCDVCETTLFNYHWVCSRCGFAVCVDCYRSRRQGTIKVWGEPGADRDEWGWLLCGNRSVHGTERLMLTQIVAGDALATLNRQVHEARVQVGMPLTCGCPEASRLQQKTDGEGDTPHGAQVKVKAESADIDAKSQDSDLEKVKSDGCGVDAVRARDKKAVGSPLTFLANVALSDSGLNSDDNSDSDSDGGGGGAISTLRRHLMRSTADDQGTQKPKLAVKKERPRRADWSMEDTLDEVLDKVSAPCGSSAPAAAGQTTASATELRHFVRRGTTKRGLRERLPIRIMTLIESRRLYKDVPHSWLCDGKLLRLHDTRAADSQRLFRDQWMRGQPVLCSGIGSRLNTAIWSVDSFIRDFGDVRNDLINCKTGNIVPNQPMRRFWEGFECVSRRLRDESGEPMILKLKDWPPGDDFADMLPDRFKDLMDVLPMTEYTRRDGRLNLASCLPDAFVRPDLGPKMYIAYGCVLHPSKASTNLHLDISDAVNIMVHVGIPPDGDADKEEALRAIDEAGCDQLTKRRVKEEMPGALWHIYHAADADKIRDLLNKVAIERGDLLEPHHDPIHDQSWYLDCPLRRRLYEEYAVEGYPIVQCAGDAVFIPAGAPHQVRNLYSCIKVAEDFVSPENIGHCFDLTQEFRSLSDTHTNHEDKLQIKNIIYHTMKDAVSCVLAGSSEAVGPTASPDTAGQ